MMEANLSIGGNVIARRGERASLAWKLSNLPNVWRGAWRYQLAKLAKIPTFFAVLEARVVRADGSIVNYGVIGTRQVTTAFVTALATYMYDASGVAPTAYDYHACGTGTNAEASGDTTLQTDSGVARVSGTASNPGAGQYRSVGTMSFTGSAAITEHGLFSASTGGTLLDRTVFSAINVVNGDSIQFTYTLTISAGG
jgi:hypothetical protein